MAISRGLDLGVRVARLAARAGYGASAARESYPGPALPHHRRQPLLRKPLILAFALQVVLDLIVADLADGKVLRLRVGEVETAHRSGGPHGE